MKKIQGFTLVEMLVSMVLLTMVLLIASNAYSLFSERWNGRLGHFNQSLTHAKHLILVQESLKSIVSYVVTDNSKQPKLYFEGNRNGFVAVTLRSLFTPELAAVIRLQVVQNEDFTFKMLYQESPMSEQLLTNATQPLAFKNSITLFDNLTEVNFQYYGWPSLESKNWTPDSSLQKPESKGWFEEFNSLETRLQPEQILISFVGEGRGFTLQAKLADPIPGVFSNYAELE